MRRIVVWRVAWVAALALPVAALALPVAARAAARIAYVTSHRTRQTVWLADVGGHHRRALGPGADPQVAPDGDAVAATLFSGSKGPALAVYRVGGPTLRLFDIAKAQAAPLAWSADSRYLAVALTSDAATASDRGSGLAVVDTTTGTVTSIAAGDVCGASFEPGGGDELVYGLSPASAFCLKRSDLYTAAPDGTGVTQITHDGLSLNPVWGPNGIAFDRMTPRPRYAPIYQIWLLAPASGQARQLTHLRPPKLLDGLVPVAVSADGTRLLASYEGEDTNEAYAVTVASGRARLVRVHRQYVQAGTLSRNGRSMIVQVGGFEGPVSGGDVEVVPFAGGHARVLVRHAGQPSWNR